jgi:hypothetical protein
MQCDGTKLKGGPGKKFYSAFDLFHAKAQSLSRRKEIFASSFFLGVFAGIFPGKIHPNRQTR